MIHFGILGLYLMSSFRCVNSLISRNTTGSGPGMDSSHSHVILSDKMSSLPAINAYS